jgi:hypothetical protein
MRPFGKIAKLNRADGNSDESKHFDAEGIEHASDLAVFAFVENDLDPGVLFASTDDVGALCCEHVAFRNFDAALESFQQVCVGDGTDLDMIGFVEMRGGIGDARSPFGVVGQKKKAFAGLIEPAHGNDPAQIQRKERVDSVAPFLIGGGGNDAAGLIEEEIDLFGGNEQFAFHLNAIHAETNRRFGISRDSAIKADFAITDKVERPRARAVPEFGECASQADMFDSGCDAAGSLETLGFHGSDKKFQLFFSGPASGCFTSP